DEQGDDDDLAREARQPDHRDEEGPEAQQDADGRAYVDRRAHGARHEADDDEAQAHVREEPGEHPWTPPELRPALRESPLDVMADELREDGDEQPRDDDGEVEPVAGDLVDVAELREMQLPPRLVRRA